MGSQNRSRTLPGAVLAHPGKIICSAKNQSTNGHGRSVAPSCHRPQSNLRDLRSQSGSPCRPLIPFLDLHRALSSGFIGGLGRQLHWWDAGSAGRPNAGQPLCILQCRLPFGNIEQVLPGLHMYSMFASQPTKS